MNEEIRQQNSNQQEEASEREKKGQEMIGKRKPEKKENGWGSFLAGAVTVNPSSDSHSHSFPFYMAAWRNGYPDQRADQRKDPDDRAADRRGLCGREG
mgnify:CR=1 FL=1